MIEWIEHIVLRCHENVIKLNEDDFVKCMKAELRETSVQGHQ